MARIDVQGQRYDQNNSTGARWRDYRRIVFGSHGADHAHERDDREG
jgi:hypothetical protein